ncbi:2-oxo-4-hydroxy-4-carboxy-5-ureidoimidazoline decarboxylase-like [Amphiura filiformis]|uniref:2-oxo-4-hydroxy-4-carboxy-5-ureidoimidazoline decarboxylase-like n=1 Tax=Amphiura filiformis TaxID=82378 RepID=UPI003B21FEC1
MAIAIADVNQMSYEEFLDSFGNIIQAAKWMTSSLWSFRPYSSTIEIHRCVCKMLDTLPLEVKEGLLRGLPDLAGREARENKLGFECKKEQRAAGLLRDLPETKQVLINNFNARYRAKFNFPFVLCARENKMESIVNGFRNRIGNSREEEVEIGIGEIKKICWYRLCDIVSSPTMPEYVSKL